MPLSAVAGVAFTRQPLFALLGPAFLAPVLSRYFLVPRFRLDRETARAGWGTGQTEIAWANVSAVVETAGALRLSPVASTDPRSRHRGVELLLPSDELLAARIRDYVRAALPESVAFRP